MNIGSIPLFEKLNEGQNILIAGAGGGFDLFSGLPIYFALKKAGKNVHLANLSFSDLSAAEGRRVAPACLEVHANSTGDNAYFPEKHLAQWFVRQGEALVIYAFERTGAILMRNAYAALCAELNIDTVLLIDGGTDSLMRGDEFGLGTPHEDLVSIAAVDDLEVERKLLACLGFGIDHYHGVCHAHFLEAVAALEKAGGYLGSFSLLGKMEEARRLKEAYDFVERHMPLMPSIVTSSIISAIDGEYGNYHATFRTAGSKLWINPLMGLYWAFELEAVARRCLYLDQVKKTTTYVELNEAIRRFRSSLGALKEWKQIPV